MKTDTHYDIVIVGSGPAGQKAAIQGAKAQQRVLIIEQARHVGGACVRHGTIPSKTLRESAFSLYRLRQLCLDGLQFDISPDLKVAHLMARLDQVVQAHQHYMTEQLRRNGIEHLHGKARFIAPHDLEILSLHGNRRQVSGNIIIVATGSRPRTPPDVPVDHQHILDSDSILSMLYVPDSLTILGAGVIASEYASIFSLLGSKVTLIDQAPSPLNFIDPELTACFVRCFEANGGRFLGQRQIDHVRWNGSTNVETKLQDGTVIESDKLLCALGRLANTENLNLTAAGLQLTERGYLAVDAHCRTSVPHIYAAGDVIGPPALASFSMEQGRRAVCHALNIPLNSPPELIPTGVYTVPEISCIGLSEQQAVERFGAALIGRAYFSELARGQIIGETDGILKLVTDPQGKRLLGIHIVGSGATELIHVGQMGLLAGCDIDTFVDDIFNFPTLAEAYRIAALDIVKQRPVPASITNANHANRQSGSSTTPINDASTSVTPLWAQTGK
ncbi:MAG: Si-specific NAD(P)(+) transhydrogenase [bacterium]|nr:Si-specific NAD(P)(+) transhydrogenase [bacterium]